MKQALLAALLAAVAASALTLLLRPAPRAEPAGPTASEFRAILADFSAELAALRRDAPASEAAPRTVLLPPPSRPEETPPAPDSTPVPAVEIEPAAEDVPVMEEAEAVVIREERSAIARPAELVEKLRGLANWEGSAEVRKAWILSGEEAVLSSFGKPDEIWVQENGVEVWNYRAPTGARDEDGDPEWKDIMVMMNRGRLVFVDD